jgi:hypothetical protein
MPKAVVNKLLGVCAVVVGVVVLYITLGMGTTATWIGLVVCLAAMLFLASKC